MLVVLMDNQLIPPRTICSSCLMADQEGKPRWRHGTLCCGRLLAKASDHIPDQYECQMGFRIADIDT